MEGASRVLEGSRILQGFFSRHFLQDDLLQACREVRSTKLVYAAGHKHLKFQSSDLAGHTHTRVIVADQMKALGMLAVTELLPFLPILNI